MNAVVLAWGLLPMVLGFGFIFRPRLMAKWHRGYSSWVQRIQKRFVKAHRATGLLLINVSVVILLTWFYPVWIYNSFLVARIITGALFPSLFAPVQGISIPVTPTVWI